MKIDKIKPNLKVKNYTFFSSEKNVEKELVQRFKKNKEFNHLTEKDFNNYLKYLHLNIQKIIKNFFKEITDIKKNIEKIRYIKNKSDIENDFIFDNKTNSIYEKRKGKRLNSLIRFNFKDDIYNIKLDHLGKFDVYKKQMYMISQGKFGNSLITPSMLRNIFSTDFIKNKIIEKVLNNETLTQEELKEEKHFLNLINGFIRRNTVYGSVLSPNLVKYLLDNIIPIKHFDKGKGKLAVLTFSWGSFNLAYFYQKNYNSLSIFDSYKKVKKMNGKLNKYNFDKKYTNVFLEDTSLSLGNTKYIKKKKEKYDTIFFCPPYFKLERYDISIGENSLNQSSGGYKKLRLSKKNVKKQDRFKLWVDTYVTNTIKNGVFILKKGGYLAYILSDYKKGNDYFDIKNNFIKICENNGLKLVDRKKILKAKKFKIEGLYEEFFLFKKL